MFVPEAALREVLPMLRVLIVEDDPDTIESTRFLLEAWGYSVLIASSGPVAVKAANASHLDVVLLDRGLPGMDGFAVAQQIRQFGGKQPVIICISGYGQDKDRRRAHDVGCDYFFLKPVDPNKLRDLLQTMITANRPLLDPS
jgi:CheY-like chemotaxis protein